MVRRAFRRPDQLRLIGEDRKKLLLMVDTVLRVPLEQLAETIFLDECIFSVKSFKHMAWANTGENIQQSQILPAQPCIAVLAAVSIQRGMLLYHMRPKSFNGHTFSDFLVDLRDSLGHSRPITIVLDNCQIHKT